jgi:hypothetical protein
MFSEKLNEAQEEYGTGGGSNFYKFQNGKNRIRILAGGGVIANHWMEGRTKVCFGIKNGCPYHGEGAIKNAKGEEVKPTAKTIVYVLDKRAEPYQIKLLEMPWSVTKKVDTLEKDDEWGFEGLPMPYDLVVTVANAGSKEVEYDAQASAKDKGPVPAEVLEKLKTLPTVEEYVTKKKAKAKVEFEGGGGKDVQIGSLDDVFGKEEIKPEDIPF